MQECEQLQRRDLWLTADFEYRCFKSSTLAVLLFLTLSRIEIYY